MKVSYAHQSARNYGIGGKLNRTYNTLNTLVISMAFEFDTKSLPQLITKYFDTMTYLKD